MPGLVRNAPGLLLLFAGIAFSLPVETGHDAHAIGGVAYAALEPPALRLAVRGDGVHLRSHTVSAAHERELADIVQRREEPATFEFLPLGVAPNQWRRATVGLLEAARPMLAADIELTGNFAVVAGVVDADFDASRALAAVPASLVVDAALITADTSRSAATLCEREFRDFDPGDIRFEESGTSLRTSAFPAIDRVVALADACRRSRVVITGHTDASGDEVANRALSGARAEFVADLIASRGINRDRIVARGAGSTEPLADNGTRYGRSLNRRIEVSLLALD